MQIPTEVMEKYSYGNCTVLAVALNRRFGWPIYVAFEDGQLTHAWVGHPSGRGLDIAGWDGHKDFLSPRSEVRLVSSEALIAEWSITPEQIAEADTTISEYLNAK